MAVITFYEKPGCINNTKQKKLLTLAGHEVIAENLLTHPWTEAELLSFFGELDVPAWFNPNAPDVYNGIVDPKAFTRESALKTLMETPLLIKRPLMKIGDKTLVGFDKVALDKTLAITAAPSAEVGALLSENLTDCPRKETATVCE